jgi:LPXTG-motif cell wall-anchored protein
MMPVSQTAEMAKRIGGANYGPSEYDGGVFGDFPVPVGSALAVTNTFTAEQSVAPGRYVDSTRNGGVFGDFPVPVGATLAVAPLNYGRTQRGGVFSDFTVPVGTQMTVSDANYAKFQRGGVLSGNSAGMRGLGDSNGCHLLKGQEIPYTWSCTEPNAILNDFATGWVAWKAKQLSMPDGTVAQRAEVIKAAQAASGMSTWKTYVSDVQTGKYLPGFGVHVPGGQPSQEPGAPPAPGAPPESGSSNTTLYVGLALTALLGVGGYMWWKKHKAA